MKTPSMELEWTTVAFECTVRQRSGSAGTAEAETSRPILPGTNLTSIDAFAPATGNRAAHGVKSSWQGAERAS